MPDCCWDSEKRKRKSSTWDDGAVTFNLCRLINFQLCRRKTVLNKQIRRDLRREKIRATLFPCQCWLRAKTLFSLLVTISLISFFSVDAKRSVTMPWKIHIEASRYYIELIRRRNNQLIWRLRHRETCVYLRERVAAVLETSFRACLYTYKWANADEIGRWAAIQSVCRTYNIQTAEAASCPTACKLINTIIWLWIMSHHANVLARYEHTLACLSFVVRLGHTATAASEIINY